MQLLKHTCSDCKKEWWSYHEANLCPMCEHTDMDIQKVKSVPAETLVMPKIVEVKQKIKEHFESENVILDNAKTEMSDKEYEYRKAELARQKFYMMLILSNFSA